MSKKLSQQSFQKNKKNNKKTVYKKYCLAIIIYTRSVKTAEIFLGSSMAEHSAVNRRVVGSSPTRGAILKEKALSLLFLCFLLAGTLTIRILF